MDTAKISLDSTLVANGPAVVETESKVYITNNVFVVDASSILEQIT